MFTPVNMSLALIETAREHIKEVAQERVQTEAVAAVRAQELSTIHQISKTMFDDCMGILRAEKDPPSQQLPPINLVDNLLTILYGHERRATRTYEDNAGESVRVVLDGRPLRGNLYAYLRVIGLPDSLFMSIDPKTEKIESCIRHHADPEKRWSYTSKPIGHPSELQPWRELVDFLKEPQKT